MVTTKNPLRAHQPFHTLEETCLLRSLPHSHGAMVHGAVFCPGELYQTVQTFAPGLERCAVEAAQQMQTYGLASEGLVLPHQSSRLACAGKGVAQAASGVTKGARTPCWVGQADSVRPKLKQESSTVLQKLGDPKADLAGLSAARNTVGSEEGKDGPERHASCSISGGAPETHFRGGAPGWRRTSSAGPTSSQQHFLGPKAQGFSIFGIWGLT
ncbi:hypothetical protein HJG60_008503 [Phyllostomus discolor]|uniref:Uncharacterized protein n=1 Tax=Phyllostomus discolor TaxID=89673 RepID=A0A833Z4F4_9CHIR|nr:hypothetical protein HJG60_008503 [Phyllostomus discolor]